MSCDYDVLSLSTLKSRLCVDMYKSSPEKIQKRVIEALDRTYTDIDLINATLATSPLTGSIYVATNGSDTTGDGTFFNPFASIKAALTSITDNSSTNRYTIFVAPGAYTEDNPLQLKQFVSIVGSSNIGTAITALNPTQDLFVLSDVCSVAKLALSGVTTGFAVSLLSSGACKIKELVFLECGNCIKLDHASAILYAVDIVVSSLVNTTTTAFKITNGRLTIDNTQVIDYSKITTVFNVSGSVTIRGLLAFSPYITTVIYMDNASRNFIYDANLVLPYDGIVAAGGANFVIRNSAIFGSANDCMRIEENVADGSNVEFSGVSLDGSGNYDLNVLGTNHTIYGFGVIQYKKINIDPSVTLHTALLDRFVGDEALKILGELHVGSSRRGAESCLGEGDSFTYGMYVYTDNGAGTQLDKTTEAASVSGSTFSFQDKTAGNMIYIGCNIQNMSDYYQFFGIKVLTETATVLGTGDIVFEYWNGSAWMGFNWMSTDGDDPYYTRNKSRFELVGSYQYRFNYKIIDDWTKNDPITALSGTNRYWVRIRITSNITTAPVFQQIKLHSNRREINSDGWPEYFGKARPVATLPFHFGLIGKSVALGDQNIYLGDNVYGLYTNNLWNGDGDQAPIVSTIPIDCDTSTPLTLKWVVRPSATGTVSWTVRWAYSMEGETLYTSAPGSDPSALQSVVVSGSIVDGEQKTFEADLDISDLRARIPNGQPDVLWITIERTTSSGNLAGLAINPTYLKWCDGGHY